MKLSMWLDLMTNLGLSENELEYRSIQRAYREKHRHYHNTFHIMDCLSKVDSYVETSSNYSLKLAIWYHDIVYNTFKRDNELRSAEVATDFLDNQMVSKELKSEVHDLIMATVHQKEPNTINEAYIMDIDISVLGSSPKNYNTYTNKIRKEYWLIPWFLYKRKRIEVMQMFLRREKLYFTDYFRHLYEEQARRNISNEISKLKKMNAI